MTIEQVAENKYPRQRKRRHIKKVLMNEREIAFFEKMKKGLKGLYVFPQVSMNQVLDIEQQRGWNDRAHFWAMIIDFVVCTPQCQVIAIVELDGPSHDSEEQKEKDKKRDAMLTEAGYIVIRYDWRETTTDAQLNNDFKRILKAWNLITLQEQVQKNESKILRMLGTD